MYALAWRPLSVAIKKMKRAEKTHDQGESIVLLIQLMKLMHLI